MNLPTGYTGHWREPDGVWCVQVRRLDGKRSWYYAPTEAEALERASVDTARGGGA